MQEMQPAASVVFTPLKSQLKATTNGITDAVFTYDYLID